ncbi:MAG: hypothetical protein ISP63_00295 [Flavobacteriaceae bacterium]|nr:hypothetical protein [Flavobacteriaceae bacterium]
MINGDQLKNGFYPLLFLLAALAGFLHQSFAPEEAREIVIRCYVLNTLLAALIHFVILRLRDRHSEKLGFLFLIGSSLKFLFFFLFIYPVFNADGDLSSMEFATFFIPYSLTTAVETVVLVQQLNRS